MLCSARVPGRGWPCRSANRLAPAVGPHGSSVAPPHLAAGLLDGFCPEPQPEDHLAVNAQGRLLLLRLADVDWLEADGDRVALHAGDEIHFLTGTLAAAAAKLPPGLFLRVGASALVNTRQIKRLRRLCCGEWQVLLRNGTRLVPQFVLGQAATLVAKYRRAAPDQIPSA